MIKKIRRGSAPDPVSFVKYHHFIENIKEFRELNL
jgi:hypothetical protein